MAEEVDRDVRKSRRERVRRARVIASAEPVKPCSSSERGPAPSIVDVRRAPADVDPVASRPPLTAPPRAARTRSRDRAPSARSVATLARSTRIFDASCRPRRASALSARRSSAQAPTRGVAWRRRARAARREVEAVRRGEELLEADRLAVRRDRAGREDPAAVVVEHHDRAADPLARRASSPPRSCRKARSPVSSTSGRRAARPRRRARSRRCRRCRSRRGSPSTRSGRVRRAARTRRGRARACCSRRTSVAPAGSASRELAHGARLEQRGVGRERRVERRARARAPRRRSRASQAARSGSAARGAPLERARRARRTERSGSKRRISRSRGASGRRSAPSGSTSQLRRPRGCVEPEREGLARERRAEAQHDAPARSRGEASRRAGRRRARRAPSAPSACGPQRSCEVGSARSGQPAARARRATAARGRARRRAGRRRSRRAVSRASCAASRATSVGRGGALGARLDRQDAPAARRRERVARRAPAPTSSVDRHRLERLAEGQVQVHRPGGRAPRPRRRAQRERARVAQQRRAPPRAARLGEPAHVRAEQPQLVDRLRRRPSRAARADDRRVRTISGTPVWRASTTAGRKFAAAVPDVQTSATGARAALPRPSAKKAAERSSMCDQHAQSVGSCAAAAASGVEREPGQTQTCRHARARELVEERRRERVVAVRRTSDGACDSTCTLRPPAAREQRARSLSARLRAAPPQASSPRRCRRRRSRVASSPRRSAQRSATATLAVTARREPADAAGVPAARECLVAAQPASAASRGAPPTAGVGWSRAGELERRRCGRARSRARHRRLQVLDAVEPPQQRGSRARRAAAQSGASASQHRAPHDRVLGLLLLALAAARGRALVLVGGAAARGRAGERARSNRLPVARSSRSGDAPTKRRAARPTAKSVQPGWRAQARRSSAPGRSRPARACTRARARPSRARR